MARIHIRGNMYHLCCCK